MRQIAPAEVVVTDADGNQLAPLVTVDDFKEHSADAAGTSDDPFLTSKLQAATDWIEGWTGHTGTWFRTVRVSARWTGYKPSSAGVFPMLIVPGNQPDDGTFMLEIRNLDGTTAAEPVQSRVSVEYGRYLAWLGSPRGLTADEYLHAQWTATATTPEMVREACRKLASALLVDRGLSATAAAGEGVAFRRIKELLAPYRRRGL